MKIIARGLTASVVAVLAATTMAQPSFAGSTAGAPSIPAAHQSVERLDSTQTPSGVGARVPFAEYQAEDARTNGTVLGPDRAYGTLAAEAVGRRAVRLQGAGKYVEFTLKRPANAVNVRYSIPDSADGAGLDSSLSVVVGGRAIQSLPVTSRYSWYYGVYPWTNTPADGGRRQLYDDSRVMLGKTLPAGTRVRLQVGAADTAPWYVIDVADFELVAPPVAQPAGSLSVLDLGADPTGRKDSSDAIQAALDQARRPAGRSGFRAARSQSPGT